LAILNGSNASHADGDALGDQLADCVHAGGVAVASFANTDATPDRFLAGLWPTYL
jgi:hypothetical protein